MIEHQTTEPGTNGHLFCPYCGTEDKANYGYCDHCGEKVEAPDDIRYRPADLGYCTECETKNLIRARHCIGCGILIDDHPLKPSPAAPGRVANDAAYPDTPPPVVDAFDSRMETRRAPPTTRPSDRQEIDGDAPGSEDEAAQSNEDATEDNNSGTPDAVLPEALRGYNWGALILGPVWGVGNKAWFATVLFALWFLPVPPALSIPAYILGSLYIGFNGNLWAWRGRRWDSVEHFRRAQQNWAFWGFVASPLVMIGLITAPFWNSG
jgi:hypothetical protein